MSLLNKKNKRRGCLVSVLAIITTVVLTTTLSLFKLTSNNAYADGELAPADSLLLKVVKELNGRELVGFVKERQAHLVQILRSNKKRAKLVIIRDSDNPVIEKYVKLKCQYGEDIGVEVVDAKVEPKREALVTAVTEANVDETVSGIIVQLPLVDRELTEEVVSLIQPEKDVDGLSGHGKFDSATATAINWGKFVCEPP